jgi:hypothetical protein
VGVVLGSPNQSVGTRSLASGCFGTQSCRSDETRTVRLETPPPRTLTIGFSLGSTRRHAESQSKHFDETVQQRIGETFIWMLTPRQELGSAEVAWEQTRVTGSDPIPVRVSKKLASVATSANHCSSLSGPIRTG